MSTFDIPVIQPFQLDSGGDGTVDNGVNLFRGNVSFFLKLVSLKGRNGLNVNLSALYSSDVRRQVDQWNLDAPTSIMGLGWQLPIERIESIGPATGSLGDRIYDYVSGGSSNRLHRSSMRWKRGILQSGFAVDLDSQRITAPVQQSFASQALQLAVDAKVTVLTPGHSWRVVDSISETIYEIEETGSSLAIYDGGLAYELLSYKPWRIRYYLEFERWEITRENGVTEVFGGNVQPLNDTSKTSLGDSINWGVRWGNWVGPSALTHDPNNPSARVQQQYPVAWNHSRAYTLWGEEVLFEYEQVRQQVGKAGLAYTKACYLSAVTDVFDRKVQLIYSDKIYDTSSAGAAREYADPFKSQPSDEPDAFQSRYETKYLSEIHVEAANGAPLYQLSFTSSPVSYASLPDGSPPSLAGDTQKRILHSVTKRLPNGLSSPPILFTYNSSADRNRGALKTITYPKGATVTYEYQQKQLTLCSRSESIGNPLGAGATPRVWFGADYAVIAWYAEGVLSIDVYCWLGRWQHWTPPRPQFSAYLDLDRLNVAVAADFFVLFYEAQNGESTQFWVFHKDVLRLGQWLPYQKNPLINHSSQVSVATGTRFFAIADQSTGQVTRYSWDELTKAWSTTTDPNPTSDPGQTHIFITALNNYLLTFRYDRLSAPGSKKSVLELDYLDELGQWIKGDQMTVPNLKIVENPNDPAHPFDGLFNWSPDASFVACTHVTNDSTSVREYAVTVFSWQIENGKTYRLTAPKEFPYQVVKTSSGDLTVPWIAEVRANNLIASGPHLLRYNGNDWLSNNNLKVLSQIDPNTAVQFAYGSDVVLKTENSASSVIGALQAFDPNNDVTAWQSRRLDLYNGAPEGDYKTRYFPTAVADFVSWDTQLYFRGSSTDWVKPLAHPLSPGLPEGIDTTTIVNQAPSFLAYYGGSDSPAQVEVLRNGSVAKTTSLPENFFRVGKSGAAPGTFPAGPSSFLTFLPVDGKFDQADSITLNRLVDDSIRDIFTDYPIAVVNIDNGFGKNSTSYAFSEQSALCDSTGTVVKYFESTVFHGTDNALNPSYGRTKHYFVNGLPREHGGDENQYPSVVDGFPHKTVSYDTDGNEVVENVLTWDVQTTISDLFSGAADQPIFGAFTRLGEVSTTKDGVTKSLQYDYVAGTGLPRSTQSVIYNAEGVPETRVSTRIYGYEVYDWLRNAHVLSPPVQLKRTVARTGEAPIVTSVKVTTWKAFARAPLAGVAGQVFGAYQTYRWLGGSQTSDFNFAAWSNSTATPDWLKTSEVKVRTLLGITTERADPSGSVRSTLLDAAQRFPVALFTGASIEGSEAFYYGFESYESSGDWVLDTTATPIVSGNAHTGSRSLKLPGGSATKALRLTPKRPTTYLFSCWAKTPGDYNSQKPAGWRIQRTSGSSQPEVSVLSFSGSDGEWNYYHHEILVDPSAPVEIELTAFNNGDVPVYVDNVAFATATGQYVASVYEEPTHLITAETGPYNNSLQWIYNQHLQLIGRTGHDGELKNLSLSYFSRQNSQGTFDPSEPNATLLALPTGATFHDRFTAGGDWTLNWTSAQAADWQAADGWLLHTTDQAGRISLTTPAFTSSYFVYVDVKPGEEINAPIGLEVGESLAVTWRPKSQTWVLELTGKNPSENKVVQAPYTSPDPGSSWLLLMTDHAILFYVDGRMTCNCVLSEPISGAPAITTSNRAGFANFVVGEAPEIGVAFVDGSGKTQQRQTIDGTGVVVSANLYDDLGRAAVVTKHARYEDPIPKYQASFAQFDWSSGLMTGDVCTANPADGPFPFHRKRYEASPLGRIVEIGLPGEVFAIDKGHTTSFEYGTNELTGIASVLNLPASQYFMVKAINPDGVVSVVIADVLGRNVAQGTLVDAKTNRYVMSSMSERYTNDGRVVTHFLPNYYNPPDPAYKNSWIVTQPYDMLGRVLSRHGPNSGDTKYIYDVRGNVRFAQDAAASKQGIVVYTTYDLLGQMLERGTFAFQWDTALLTQQANNSPSWPGSEQGAKPRYRYTYTYSGDDPNQFGRLTSVEVVESDEASSDHASFVYNQANQLESESLRSPRYGDDVYKFTYGYDNLGRGTNVTYPSGTVFRTLRDPLGRVQSVGGGTEQRFASYEYYLSGQVKTETLSPGSSDAIARQYSYNSPGWLTAIDDGLFKETIGYTENGYDGAGYYTGQIANVQSEFVIGNPGEFPTRTEYKYEYDALSRLKVAQCSIDGQAAQDWSIGVQSPVTYDDNGNFVTFEQGSETEQYRYQPGTDFVTNSTGSQNVDYESSPTGAVTVAKPRGIALIEYDPIISRATHVKLSSGDDLRFAYDVHGRRSLKIDSKQTRLYLSGRSLRPLSEKVRPHAGGPETTMEYVCGPTGVVGQLGAAGYSTLLRDHLGSTRAVVGAAKTPLAAYHYLPFGQLVDPVFGNKDEARYLFTGYEFDSQTGLYNAGARLYDPALRRFYSVDPAHQFASPYVYAGNNPIVMVDPTGTVAAAAIAVGTVVTVLGVLAAIFTFGVSAALAVGADVADAAAEAVDVGVEVAEAVGERVAIGALNVASGTLIGAGTGGLQYGATHNRFNGREFGEALGIGALSGAVSGGIGYGVSALDGIVLDQAISGLSSRLARAGLTALRSGLEWSVAALPAQVISNAVSHDPLGQGMLSAFGISFAEGAALGALDGLVFSGRGASNAAPADGEKAPLLDPAQQPAAPPDAAAPDAVAPDAAAAGDGDNHAPPAAGPAAGGIGQAAPPQSRALIVWRPPLDLWSLVMGDQLRAAQNAIPRFLRPSLLPPPRPFVLDLPNARITLLDQSQFDMPPKVSVEFPKYLALPWYGNGTPAGEMIK